MDLTYQYEKINLGACIYPFCRHLGSLFSDSDQDPATVNPAPGFFCFRLK